MKCLVSVNGQSHIIFSMYSQISEDAGKGYCHIRFMPSLILFAPGKNVHGYVQASSCSYQNVCSPQILKEISHMHRLK